MIGPEKRFEPAMEAEVRQQRLAEWRAAMASL
jgi:hypothetical protein